MEVPWPKLRLQHQLVRWKPKEPRLSTPPAQSALELFGSPNLAVNPENPTVPSLAERRSALPGGLPI